ncbi:N-acetylglutaminylglutamine amidotransferase [Actinomycetospora chlora]|uniref:asparagine synthase (glutamine-hydrolyzing) n=1 Tax=Actinomycetospora chlora TaxID=663608 RepID=A0ABP9AGJ6_9PSEU
MCGIAGEFRFDGRAAEVATVLDMAQVLEPRGPDGWGVVGHGPLALAHQRLKIIDLSEAGAQPMVDSDLGLTAVFNGIIYNYQQLRDELHAEGYRFFSTSDTEVLLKAFHRWGKACVEHFKGMFAFAIADRRTGELVLGRDRLGIKPLYVAQVPGAVRFASSLPALLAGGGLNTDVDLVALHHYMSFHSVVPAPRTILQGVRKLPPATIRTVAPDGATDDWTFWEPVFARDGQKSAEEWAETALASLRTAVERRMVADVPVGVLLSGGIDSSIVVALLAEMGQKDLKTFSIGFESEAGESGDEFDYSDLVAKTYGTDHVRFKVPKHETDDALEGAVAAMAEPMVSHDVVAFYLLSREVSKSIKVVQSGQGADEILGGYDWYPPLANVARDGAVDAYQKAFFDRPHDGVAQLLAPEALVDSDVSRAFVAEHFARPGADSAVDAALRLDTTIMLVDDPVKRVDNMTMAWGLEARVPFLDHDFVEAMGACPPEYKLADGGKGVLKQAARGVLPDEIIDRKKGYFPVPAIRQLSGPVLERVQGALTDPAAKSRGLFRPDAVAAMLDDPNSGRTNLGANALWQVALLEMWLQAHGIT